jgi:hypothetical protein
MNTFTLFMLESLISNRTFTPPEPSFVAKPPTPSPSIGRKQSTLQPPADVERRMSMDSRKSYESQMDDQNVVLDTQNGNDAAGVLFANYLENYGNEFMFTEFSAHESARDILRMIVDRVEKDLDLSD